MGELQAGVVRRLERAIDALELAAYRDGRTHASLPAGHAERFESWDALTEAREQVRQLIAVLAPSSPSDLAAVVTPVPAAASQPAPVVLS